MIPLLLLVLGIAAIASAASSTRGQYGAPTPQVGAAPTPLRVLVGFASQGVMPPPPVILCALAEAEANGHTALANDIVRVFIAPVVQAHATRGAPYRSAPPSAMRMQPQAPVAPRASSPPPPPVNLTDDQILAALNTNPAAFMQNMASAIDVPAQEPPRMQQTPQPFALPSPISGVDAIDWSKFCDKLAREEPRYVSQRHVGQYRQRKERLAELGIDPNQVVGDPLAQRQALDVDLADAHHHVRESGLDEHVGRRVLLPNTDEPTVVTLSGVLGVIQAAGLDGAASWLGDHRDRKRFPHTTAAFARTNGMF